MITCDRIAVETSHARRANNQTEAEYGTCASSVLNESRVSNTKLLSKNTRQNSDLCSVNSTGSYVYRPVKILITVAVFAKKNHGLNYWFE